MTFTVAPLDPDDAALADRLYAISAAAVAVAVPDFPPPDRHSFGVSLREPSPGSDHEIYVARAADGTVVGYAKLDLPTLDNLENSEVEVEVDPAYRRRGAGRALLGVALDRARGHGRKRLMTIAVEQLPDGPARDAAGGAFAAAMGFGNALGEVRRRLHLPATSRAELDDLLKQAWARADGYSLVQWQDVAPDDVIADVAYLDGRLIQDAPMGDLAWEPQKVDATRARATEQAMLRHKRKSYHTGVRHDASGRLVAWTTIGRDHEDREHGFQWITIVDPDHRGRRLGTIVKVENLYYTLANEPALREIDTWNAAGNRHMIAINEAMGFRSVDGWANWQRDL